MDFIIKRSKALTAPMFFSKPVVYDECSHFYEWYPTKWNDELSHLTSPVIKFYYDHNHAFIGLKSLLFTVYFSIKIIQIILIIFGDWTQNKPLVKRSRPCFMLTHFGVKFRFWKKPKKYFYWPLKPPKWPLEYF